MVYLWPPQGNTGNQHSSQQITGQNSFKAPWRRIQRLWAGSSLPLRIFIASICLLLVAGSSVGLVLAVLHTQEKPDGYLWSSNTGIIFVQFTEDENGHLTGIWHAVAVTRDEQVQTDAVSFTGIHNGSQLGFTFSALGISYTITGTYEIDKLTLNVPDQNGYIATYILQGASVSDYNNAEALLRKQVATAAQATQVAQATATTQAQLDQAVRTANQQLQRDLNALTSDVQALASATNFNSVLSAYASDWQRMQQDYQQEQTDYQKGCGDYGYNASVVSYDASVVNYDLGTIQYDDSSLDYDKNQVNSPLNQVQSDIQAVQSDWQQLQNATAADNGRVSAAFTSNDVNTALKKAQDQVDTSNQALQSAQLQATQYDNEAAQMNTNAQNLANSLHCS